MPRKWFLTALGGTTGGNGTAGQGRVPLQRGPQADVVWPEQHRQPAVSIYSTERASRWTPSMASMPSALGFLLTIFAGSVNCHELTSSSRRAPPILWRAEDERHGQGKHPRKHARSLHFQQDRHHQSRKPSHLIRVGILREAGRMWQAIAPLGELEAELDRTGVAGSERE